jgi:hypothetical protein
MAYAFHFHCPGDDAHSISVQSRSIRIFSAMPVQSFHRTGLPGMRRASGSAPDVARKCWRCLFVKSFAGAVASSVRFDIAQSIGSTHPRTSFVRLESFSFLSLDPVCGRRGIYCFTQFTYRIVFLDGLFFLKSCSKSLAQIAENTVRFPSNRFDSGSLKGAPMRTLSFRRKVLPNGNRSAVFPNLHFRQDHPLRL